MLKAPPYRPSFRSARSCSHRSGIAKAGKRAAGFFIGFLHHGVEQAQKRLPLGRIDLKKTLSVIMIDFLGR
ncbi:hypothetical protein M5585_15620 [Serratia ureilytica]